MNTRQHVLCFADQAKWKKKKKDVEFSDSFIHFGAHLRQEISAVHWTVMPDLKTNHIYVSGETLAQLWSTDTFRNPLREAVKSVCKYLIMNSFVDSHGTYRTTCGTPGNKCLQNWEHSPRSIENYISGEDQKPCLFLQKII